nr:DnaD domain protein [Ligilactobacillus agilis]
MPVLADYVYRLGDELVCHAIEQMSLQANKPNFNYLQRILNNYDKSGIKTVEDAIKSEEAFKANRQKRTQYRTGTRGIVQKETLPDWAKPGYQEAEVADDPDKSAEIARLMAKIKDGTNGD